MVNLTDHSLTTSGEFDDSTGGRRDAPRPASQPGALRPLACALISAAEDIRAARRVPLGREPEVRVGSAVSFGRSVGRQSWRHRAASPDVTGPASANPHVGAPGGSPVVDSDLLGGSS